MSLIFLSLPKQCIMMTRKIDIAISYHFAYHIRNLQLKLQYLLLTKIKRILFYKGEYIINIKRFILFPSIQNCAKCQKFHGLHIESTIQLLQLKINDFIKYVIMIVMLYSDLTLLVSTSTFTKLRTQIWSIQITIFNK